LGLDARQEAAELQKMYEDDPRQSTFNLLLLGESGTGKTYILRTARRPVHIDSFDPGGTKCLRDQIKSGDVIPDVRFEHEDFSSPHVHQEWEDIFKHRVREGYFDSIGTYAIDSATSWAGAILGKYLKAKGGKADAVPTFQNHYHYQKFDLKKYIRMMLALPCDVIMTGHLKLIEDPVNGKHRYRFLTTGDGMVTIPLLFDEKYISVTEESSSGVSYKLLTKSTGVYSASTRLGRGGVLETYEEPNIKAILKKSKLPFEDKPKLIGG
jgi:hypothetical protein